MTIYISTLLVFVIHTYDAIGVNRRLLLNDPDVIIHRLATMENTVAALNTTLQQVLAVNQQQENTIHQLDRQLQVVARNSSKYLSQFTKFRDDTFGLEAP